MPEARIQYKIIELLSKSVSQRPLEGFEGQDFEFDVRADTAVNSDEKYLLVVVTITVREAGQKDELASLSVGNAFLLENFSEVIQFDEKKIAIIPPDLDVLIKAMSVSTTRGIMFSEFRGTYLMNAILPIIFMHQPQQVSPVKKEDDKS